MADQQAQERLTLLPLGGVGAFGMNAMLLGYREDFVLLDCGVGFTDEFLAGVNLLIPALDTLGTYADRLRAIVLTHGHEDHLGAVPHVLKHFNVPVYGTRYTLGLLQDRLNENGSLGRVDLHQIRPGEQVEIGPFRFDFLRVTHSLPDAVSLAIRTPVGNLLFTGDFKIDATLCDGTKMDEAGFRAFGDEGVLLMMSDSTNATVTGWSRTEQEVSETLDRVISEATGRVIVGLFSSNAYRVKTVVESAISAGRSVALIGRSLHRYARLVESHTDIAKVTPLLIDAKRIKDAGDQVVVLCTGAQGESRAALARIASDRHPHLRPRAGDTLVFSARTIPGNELPVAEMLDRFRRLGVRIISDRQEKAIHASGHAMSDELRTLIRWVRPKMFIPVHGIHGFLIRHAEIAQEEGVGKTLVIENGQRVEVTSDDLRVVGEVRCTPWYIDGPIVGDAESIGLNDRMTLAYHGVVAISALLRRRTSEVRALSHGLFTDDDRLLDDLEDELQGVLSGVGQTADLDDIEALLARRARGYFKRHTGHKPVVLAFACRRQG